MKIKNEMVIVHGQEPFTNTLIISEGVGLEHQFVIRLVRKYKTDFEEFGSLDFESRPRQKGKHGGGDVQYAELNEDQATYLITLFKNTETVRAFKIRLVKAFRAAIKEIERLRKKLNEPGRQEALQLKRDSHKLMMDVKQVVLEKEGYPVTNAEFIKENYFVNRALTGKWAAIPEPEYGTYDATLMAKIRDFNTYLLVKCGKKQDARKQMLNDFVTEYRANHPLPQNQIQ